MVDLGVALTWIAISAASAKGLSAFARAATAESVEAEATGDGGSPHEGLYPMAAPARMLGDRG